MTMRQRQRKRISDARTVRLGRETAFCAWQRRRLDTLLAELQPAARTPCYAYPVLVRGEPLHTQPGDQWLFAQFLANLSRQLVLTFGAGVHRAPLATV